jgi:uncharacterized protein (TIGR00255 family)
MLRSMTAFGRAIHSFQHGRIVIEIQSVNKKYLEVQATLPPELLRFETDLKKWISDKLTRGSVWVRVNAQLDDDTGLSVAPNMPLVRQLRSAWSTIVKELGGSASDPVNPILLADQENLLIYGEELRNETACRHALQTATQEALEQHVAMREREGLAIVKDFNGRLTLIREAITVIADRAPLAVEAYQKKLQERIQQVAGGLADNEERILREICVYADRIDITEELTRFRAHVEHFFEVMGGDQQATGKLLEFILQEMGREINTIGSKCADGEISRRVVMIKGELERIREQVQNVE